MAAANVGPDEVAEQRATSPGGWKRVVVGLLVGLIAGAIVALLLPRDTRTPAVMPAPSEPMLPPGEVSRGLAGPADRPDHREIRDL